jgi:magnesium transporter
MGAIKNSMTGSPISIIHYDEDRFEERRYVPAAECEPYASSRGVTWINVDSLTDTGVLKSIGEYFDLHELTLEDIPNTTHRVKYEDFGSYVLIILKMLSYSSRERSIDTEQLSLVLGPNFVLTFQERPGDFFDGLREEIRKGDPVMHRMGSDYLACRIIDITVDNYFNVVEEFGEQIEAAEETLLASPDKTALQDVHLIKKEMMHLRRHVWPVREIISEITKRDSTLIKAETSAYFRDVYDRIFEIMDLIETTREMVSGLLDIYLSSMSNRTNEIMKVLTLVATIFIPLTFIVGLYGMNFEFMPELKQEWGYPAILILMLAVALGMLAYFRRKKWI